MNKYLELLIVTIVVICSGYISFKSEHVNSVAYEEVRLRAIEDFSTTEMHKKGSVFWIPVLDTVVRLVNVRGKDGIYKSAAGTIYRDLIAVSISIDHKKFLIDTSNKVERRGIVPSHFIEKNGKLFYWGLKRDNLLTDSTFAVYNRYHLIQFYNKNPAPYYKMVIGEPVEEEAMHYYFCRYDLSNYKRVLESTAIGDYDVPDIKCKP